MEVGNVINNYLYVIVEYFMVGDSDLFLFFTVMRGKLNLGRMIFRRL